MAKSSVVACTQAPARALSRAEPAPECSYPGRAPTKAYVACKQAPARALSRAGALLQKRMSPASRLLQELCRAQARSYKSVCRLQAGSYGEASPARRRLRFFVQPAARKTGALQAGADRAASAHQVPDQAAAVVFDHQHDRTLVQRVVPRRHPAAVRGAVGEAGVERCVE